VPYILDLEFVPQINHKQFQLDPRSKQFENKFFKMNWAIGSWKKYLAYSSIGVAFELLAIVFRKLLDDVPINGLSHEDDLQSALLDTLDE
jgi:hypothetical protein